MARGRGGLDRARRRNVIRRYGITKNSQRPRVPNLLDLSRRHREVLKEGRLVDVIALLIPLVNLSRARWYFVPFRILPGEIAVEPAENFRRQRRLHGVANFLEAWPEIAQENFLAIGTFPHRLFRKVEIDAARQGEGDHEGRRHQEIRFDVLVDARFKIAVPGKDRSRDEIKFADRLLNFRMKRPRISDAGGAAVADDVEPELIEIFLEAGLVEIIGDNPRARRE